MRSQYHTGNEKRRLRFYEWTLHRIGQGSIFVDKLIFTDKSTFIRN